MVEAAVGVKLEQSLTILSLKNFKNEEASFESEVAIGSVGGVSLERSLFSVDQSVLGLVTELEMRSLK